MINKELCEEFYHLYPTIFIYDLDIDYLRKIIDTMTTTKNTLLGDVYTKDSVEVNIKGYIHHVNAMRSQIFEHDCRENGINLDKLIRGDRHGRL